MKRRSAVVALAALLVASFLLFGDTRVIRAQTNRTQTIRDQKTRVVITKARVALSPDQYSGTLYVTINGTEREIAKTDSVTAAWVIQGGRRVVYAARGGAGGYENEGMSLYTYEAQTGKRRRILYQYYMVDKVTEVTTSRNKTALLVEMSDGGLGASYTSIVDPDRGEVFFRGFTKILSRAGDRVVLGHYTTNDWSEMIENNNTSIKPRRKETINLNQVLRRRVIINKPDRM